MTAAIDISGDDDCGTTPRTPKEVVRDFWTAVGDCEFDTAASYLSDDISWSLMGLAQVLPEGGVWVGKDRVVNGLLKLFPEVYDVTQCSFEITSMFAEGNVVFMEFDVNAMSADGRPYYGVKYVSIVEVAGEKIRWIREYPDTGLAKATLPGLG